MGFSSTMATASTNSNHAANIAQNASNVQQSLGGGSGGGGGTGGFVQNAVGGSQAGGSQAQAGGEAMMSQIRETADMQMKFQTEMGIIQLMVKMNEALAKMFKSIGEAIKGLA